MNSSPVQIHSLIFLIRNQKVMLDSDLAQLYEVETKNLVRAVNRNRSRFPEDFMFQLTKDEWENLRCQFGTSSEHGGRRFLPYAFTEHGIAMLSSVLRSEKAIQVNILIMRAFSQLRAVLSSHKEISEKLGELESVLKVHDQKIVTILEVLKQLINSPQKTVRRIGFGVEDKSKT